MEHIAALAFVFPLSAVMGGLGRRVAGGAFQQWTGIDVGDTPARLFFGFMIAFCALLAGLHSWIGAAIPIAIWIGTTLPNFGGIALGRSGNPWWQDALGLTAHGVLGMAVLAAVLCAPMPLPDPLSVASFIGGYSMGGVACILAAGFAIVPAYSIGWSVAGIGGVQSLPIGFKGGSEIGEFLWGATVGCMVVLAVLIAS